MSINPPTADQPITAQQPLVDQPPLTVGPGQRVGQAPPTQEAIPATSGTNLGLDAQSLYQAMQNYYQPLNQPISLEAPPLTDETMQAVAQQFLAVQQTNAGTLPDPNSVLAKASSHLTAGEIASQVGQQTWQQMVTDPFHQFVDTWKRDPRAGLMETLGGLAVMGGIAAASALLPETLVGLGVFAIGSALVAPGMASAWWEELRHPTDSNLVRALVNTSTGILTVGVPIKWTAGMGAARAGFEGGLRAFRDEVEPRGIAKYWITGQYGRDPRVDVALNRQMDVLADEPARLRKQFKRYNLSDADFTDTGQLLQMREAQQAKEQAWREAVDNGDETLANTLHGEMEELANGDLLHMHLFVSRNYNFLPTAGFKHVPFNAVISSKWASKKMVRQLQNHLNTAISYLENAKNGTGLANMEVLPQATSVIEHHAASLSGAGPETMINELTVAEKEISGLLKMSDQRPTFEAGKEPADPWERLNDYEKVEVGLEDPQAWKKLTPQQQLYGQIYASVINGITAAELKHGTIANPYAGRVARRWEALNPEDDVTQLYHDPTSAMKGKVMSYSRRFELAWDDAGHARHEEARTRFDILKDEMEGTPYDPAYAEFLRQHQGTINQKRRSLGGSQAYINHVSNLLKTPTTDKVKLRKQIASLTRVQAKLEALKAGGLKESLVGEGLDEATAAKVAEHVMMQGEELKKARGSVPPGRKLITGQRLFRSMVAASAYRLHAAEYNQYYYSLANTNYDVVRQAVLQKGQEKQMGAFMQDQQFRDSLQGEINFLPAKAFSGGGPESIEKKADRAGFAQMAPAIGNPEDLHYRDAVFARKELVKQLQDAHENSYSSSELHKGVAGALFKTTSTTKHVIMLSPAWHFLNVAGRAIAFMVNDPAIAIPAMRTVFGRGEFLMDERLRAKLGAEFSMAGGKRANQYNMSRQAHLNLREDSGQTTWPGVIRSMAGAIAHPYQKYVEDGFWKMVDDFQLAAYQYGKYALEQRTKGQVSEFERNQLAALYANDLGGMVNPLYMNKMYRHARNLIWFAPSYWATFMRSMLSVLPGSDRLSNFLAKYREGEFVRFGVVPLKHVSEMGRRELVRLHRTWALTYLMTAVTAADLMNVMLGGRHLWENDQGHMFDINVDKAASEFGQGPKGHGASVQHAYFSGMPMFRQAMDVANALGLGHDWGFAHQVSDEHFQQADAYQKALMLAGGLLQGLGQEVSRKTAAPLQAGYGLAFGETLSGRASGVQRELGGPFGRLGALTAFIPGGSTVERAISNPKESPGQAAQEVGGSLLQQYTGLPSIYHMGIEQPKVDDSKMTSWVSQRQTLHDSLNNASKAMFAGQIQPIQYERLRQQSVDKLLQLDADTFGNSTPTGVLSRVRLELEQANGLNQNDLTDSQWAERHDIFQMEWDQTLQNASPEARAAWWEAETQQWTDADYLVWEAQQMRQMLMAAVDGQGGQHIRAYQHQIGPLLDIPSAAMRKQLEEGDPLYYAYRQILKKISQTSSLGAFINAFVSPYSSTFIEPEQLTPDQEAALASVTNVGSTIIRPETAKALAAEAKTRAHLQAVKEAGGKAAADPGFATELAGMVSEAETS